MGESMPYYLAIKRVGMDLDIGPPIVCDNPASVFGLEDKSIARKVKSFAARIKDLPGVEDCYCHFIKPAEAQ
jgi:hypothetical protein